MNMERIREVREASGVLWRAIQSKKKELADLETVLQGLQGGCNHPGAGVYRDRLVGKCSTCLCEFRSKAEIDALYSE